MNPRLLYCTNKPGHIFLEPAKAKSGAFAAALLLLLVARQPQAYTGLLIQATKNPTNTPKLIAETSANSGDAGFGEASK